MTLQPSPASALLVEISRMPGVAERLLTDHGPDTHGRCSGGCRVGGGNASQAVPHPCYLYVVAEKALAVRCGGEVAGDPSTPTRS
jgi:hypothetical protein